MMTSSRLWDSIVSRLGRTSQKFAARRKRLEAMKGRSLQLEQCEDRLLLSIVPVFRDVDAIIEYANATPVDQLEVDWGDDASEIQQNMLEMLNDPRWIEYCKANESAAMEAFADPMDYFSFNAPNSSFSVAGPAPLSSEPILVTSTLSIYDSGGIISITPGGTTTLSVSDGTAVDDGITTLLGDGGTLFCMMAEGPTTLSVSDGTAVDEGAPITLTVDVANLADTVTEWTIDWGDETVVVTPPASGNDWGDGVVQTDSDTWTLTHTYADGDANHFIFIDMELTDELLNTATVETYYPLIPGDANKNGTVDSSDSGILANNWGAIGATWEMGDFNGDGIVNEADQIILTAHYMESTSNSDNGLDVLNVAPTLNFLSGAQANVSANGNHSATLSASDPGDDTITSVTFDWGDGQTSTGTKPASGDDWGNNITQNVDGSWTATHTYVCEGSYSVTASVTDEDGTWGDYQYQGNLLVSTLDDESDTDYTNGDLSLREALYLASQNVGTDTIVFDAALFGDGTTPGTITLSGTQLDVTSDVTIQGPGADLLTIDADGSSRVFDVDGVDANFADMTITGGVTTGDGGGILFDSATGSVTNVTVSRNKANGSGGGIGFDGTSTVTIDGSSFTGNSASQGGGLGISNDTDTIGVTVTNSTFSGNTAVSNGGGIAITGSSVTANIVNATLAGNVANAGGGIYRGASGTVNLSNSIVTFNTASSGTNVEGTLATDVSNLTGTDPLFVRAPSDGGDGWGDDPATTGTDESLNDDYGDLHLTQTSPAINAGNNSAATGLSTDLDGNARVLYQTVDIGADEYDGPILVSTSSDDPAVHGTNDYTYGNLSLREAIYLASQNSGTDTIVFDPAMFTDGSNPVAVTITLEGTHLQIMDDVYLIGPDADLLTIDADGSSRVFHVSGADVVFSGMTITGGSTSSSGGGIFVENNSNLTVDQVSIINNATTGLGGGIHAAGSTLTIYDSLISGNSGVFAGGVGALGSVIVMDGSTVSDNSATSGGGILSIAGTTTIDESTISGNSATMYAGGIHISNGTATIDRSTIFTNSAASGGGICVETSSEVTVTNSTIFANTASTSGGGIYAAGDMWSPDSLDVVNSTITANIAPIGGGIYKGGSTFTLANTIVAQNSATTSDPDVYGALDTDTNNLIGIWTDPSTPGTNTLSGTTAEPLDPQFITAPYDGGDGWGNANDDYGDLHLSSQSPTVHAGDNQITFDLYLTSDLDGNDRIFAYTADQEAHADIGAQEISDRVVFNNGMSPSNLLYQSLAFPDHPVDDVSDGAENIGTPLPITITEDSGNDYKEGNAYTINITCSSGITAAYLYINWGDGNTTVGSTGDWGTGVTEITTNTWAATHIYADDANYDIIVQADANKAVIFGGDTNYNGVVDSSDLCLFSNNWQVGVPVGDPSVTWDMGDFNGDFKVDSSDFSLLANNWQTNCGAQGTLNGVVINNVVPTANPDIAITDKDTTVSIDVLFNDTDKGTADVLSVSVEQLTSVLGAAISLNPDDTIAYDPTASTYLQNLAGQEASDTLYYTLSDGDGGTTTGTISVIVKATTGTIYYVNDSATTNDSWCTAVGDDTNNDGLSPSAPKATVQAVLDAYILAPGDVVRIDTGIYTSAITVAESGSAAAPITIEASPLGVGVLNSISFSGDYITLTTSENTALLNVVESYMRVANGDIDITGSGITVEKIEVIGSGAGDGIDIHGGTASDIEIKNALIRNYATCINVDQASNVTIQNNTLLAGATSSAAHGVWLDDTADVTLENNIIKSESYDDGTLHHGNCIAVIIDTPTMPFLTCNYNDLYGDNAGLIDISGTEAEYATLAAWQAAASCDANSISIDPQFPTSPVDYHLTSQSGRYDPSTGYSSSDPSAWVTDASSSPALDAGNVWATWEREENGDLVNLGAYGNTSYASLSDVVTDVTAPVVTVESLLTNDQTPELWGQVNELDMTSIEVTVNGVTYEATNLGDGTWALPDGTIETLAENTYDVIISAMDASGNSQTYTYTGALEVNYIDAAFTDLEIASISSTRVDLSWVDTSNDEDSYYVYRWLNNSWVQFGPALAADSNATTIHGWLDPTQQYHFRVLAYDSALGIYSLPGDITTPTRLEETPDGLTVEPTSDTEVVLNWNNIAQTHTGYEIDRMSTDGSWTQIGSVAANDTTFTHSGLSEGELCSYRVRATHDFDFCNSSNSSLAYTTTLPAAPDNLTIDSMDGGEVTLTWYNHSSIATHYYVELQVGSDWQTIGSTLDVSNPTTTATVFASFAPTTAYNLRVRALGPAYYAEDQYSQPVTIATTTAAWPTDPSNLTLTAISDTQIDLAWDNDPTGATYEVYHSTDNATWTLLDGTLNDTDKSYSHTSITEGEESLHYYKVRAFNGSNGSAYTANSTTTLLADPTLTSATIASGSQVALQWTNESLLESGYIIEQLIDTDWQAIGEVAADVITQTVEGSFAPGTEYKFRVITYREDGNGFRFYSAPSNELAVTTGAWPDAPAYLGVIAVSDTEINVSWVDTTGETGYEIEWSLDGSSWSSPITLSQDTTSYNHSSLTEGTAYYYRVRATNGLYSAYATGNGGTLPTAPVALPITTYSGTEIQLEWTDHSDNEAGFFIEEWIDDAWEMIQLVDPDTETQTITGTFEPETEYRFQISAWTNEAASEPLTTLSSTTTITTPAWPAAPTNLDATAVSGTEIDLSWTEPLNTDNYTIEMQVEGSDTWTVVDTVTAPASTYPVTGLDAGGTGYSFRIIANNGFGSSPGSNSTGMIRTQNQSPTIDTPAAAAANPVTGTSTVLSVLGADDAPESYLRYKWSVVSVPGGGKASFSVNNTNAAKDTTVTFTKVGNYTFSVKVMDMQGLSVMSNVTVTVEQTTSNIKVTPGDRIVYAGKTLQFNALARDQFGDEMNTQPTFSWNVTTGSISNGFYTAQPASSATVDVTASADGITGTAIARNLYQSGHMLLGDPWPYDYPFGQDQWVSPMKGIVIYSDGNLYGSRTSYPPSLPIWCTSTRMYFDFLYPVTGIRFGPPMFDCIATIYYNGGASVATELVSLVTTIAHYVDVTHIALTVCEPWDVWYEGKIVDVGGPSIWNAFSATFPYCNMQVVDRSQEDNEVTTPPYGSKCLYVDKHEQTDGIAEVDINFFWGGMEDYAGAMKNVVRLQIERSDGLIMLNESLADYSCEGSLVQIREELEFTDEAHDFVIKSWYDSNDNEIPDETYSQAVHLSVLSSIDLDIDSDNNNGYDLPDRDDSEDEIEDIADDITKPGKIIGVNDQDDDQDGIPNFADGYNFDGIAGNEDDLNTLDPELQVQQFVPIVVEIPEDWDVSKSQIRFTYDDSDPAEIAIDEQEQDGETTKVYTPASGALRIWTADSDETRTTADFLENNAWYSASSLTYDTVKRSVTFYVEGITPSTQIADQAIKVEIKSYDYPNTSSSDTVQTTVVGLQLLRGDVEYATGRGATGTADDVLHPLDGDTLPSSNPVPQVVLNNVTVGTISETAAHDMVTQISVAGYVTAPLADIIPANEADPTSVTVRVAGQTVGTLSLTRVAEATSLLRPYAAHYEFSGSFSNVSVLPYDNSVEVEVMDPATENTAYDIAKFSVSATQEPPASDIDVFELPFFARDLNQPLKMEVDFGTATSLAEVEANGDDAIALAVKRSFESDTESISDTAALSLGAGNPLIFNDGGSIEVEITNTSNIGLLPTVLGSFTAIIRASELNPNDISVLFEETAIDSNVFRTVFYEVIATFDNPLDDATTEEVFFEIRKVLWDIPGLWETATLTETATDSETFTYGGISMSVVDHSGFLTTMEDQMGISVNVPSLGLVGYDIDVQEEGDNTLHFTTDNIFALPSSPVIDYGTAWIEGPWAASAVTYMDGSGIGNYVPLMVKVLGPVELADLGLTGTVFGLENEHTLIEQNGTLFFSGSPSPGVFASISRLKRDASFGAGHITSEGGFKWAELNGGPRSNISNIYDAISEIFENLKYKASMRYTLRTSAYSNPGEYYYPSPLYDAATDPAKTFADFLWNTYFEVAKTNLGKATVDDEVRAAALKLMTKTDTHEKPVIGIPNSPNQVYADAKAADIFTTGSKYLLGYPMGVFDIETDGATQSQNVTDIIHFNTGLGWGDIIENVNKLMIIYDSTDSPEEKKVAVVNWLIKYKYASDAQVKRIKSVGNIIAFHYISKFDRFRELIDAVRMIKAFGGTGDSTSVFMAYDIVSGEGFDTFGIDAINDIVATDAGARLGEELSTPGSCITSAASLKERIDFHMREARKSLQNTPVFTDREKAFDAFFSVMTVTDDKGKFLPVGFWLYGKWHTTWKATLGTICQKNEKYMENATTQDTLVNKIYVIAANLKTFNPNGLNINKTDYLALQQIIEVLAFLEGPI